MNNETVVDDDEAINSELDSQLSNSAPEAGSVEALMNMTESEVAALSGPDKRKRTMAINKAGGHSRPASHSHKEDTAGDTWSPGSSLLAPPPRPGYLQRFVRVKNGDKTDGSNIVRTKREGYAPRLADTMPEGYKELGITDGDYAGAIGFGDLVLFEIPIEVNQKRESYYRNRTDRMTSAVGERLQSDQVSGHPIAVTQKSNVQVGR